MMDIRKAEVIKCSAGIATDCGTCESCVLKRKLTFAGEWIKRISETKKQHYIRSLVQRCNSIEMLSSLIRLLQPLQHKDFIYSKSKVNATFDKDLVSVTNLSNQAITSETIEIYMLEDVAWFTSATCWAQFNYLMRILKFCNSFTLDNVTSFLMKHYETLRKQILSADHGQRKNDSHVNIKVFTNAGKILF